MLLTDVKTYMMADMKKERRAARFLGWTNLVLGVVLLIASHVFRYWWLQS